MSALLLPLCLVVHAQEGFLSIDCGKPAVYSSDDANGISYESDDLYIDTGENHNISVPIPASTSDPKLQDLRSFPEGIRNCYALTVDGGKYLVRAYFLYGNYDGLNKAPQFQLHLGTNLWANVSFPNASSVVVHEIIAYAGDKSVQVCLVNTNSGEPFISALELRPFSTSGSAYPAHSSQSLIKVARIDCGGQSPTRYPDDDYDRIWTPFLPPLSTTLSSSSIVVPYQYTNVPSKVMQTAATRIYTDDTIDFSWPVDESRGQLYYHIMLHFAELKLLAANESRFINYEDNGVNLLGNYTPAYLKADSNRNLWSLDDGDYSKLEFSFSAAPGSSLPPIINAMEIFEVRYLEENGTDTKDVGAMLDIKKYYKLQKNWMGDPCAPKEFLWEGLLCNYDDKPYRIVYLDLSNSGLVGNLSKSLADLTNLQTLNLSSNKLSGDIPEFLGELPNIQVLDLRCSGLNGSVPKALQGRAAVKLLNISTGPCLPAPDVEPNPRPRKNQTFKIAVASVVGLVLLVLVVSGLIFWWWKRHPKPKPAEASTPINGTPPSQSDSRLSRMTNNFKEFMAKGGSCSVFLGHLDNGTAVAVKKIPDSSSKQCKAESDCRLFRYKELVRMTNNFTELLGKGGSCSVFLGHLDNGTAVAVKKLTESSSKQFKAEVEVLKAINHRYLITLIGYCEDKRNLALVYEYMPRGSLADQLSVGSYDGRETLSWRDRVRIAYEAAQGLEYLHYGCRKHVIHRDVKSTNILLAADNGARIADFGISKAIPTSSQGQQAILPSTRILGTPGYVDPEYMGTGTPTEKSDVYSFGVILLELITGLPAIRSKENDLLVHWVEKQSQTADLDKIVDRRLKGYNQDFIWAMLELAVNCTRAASLSRPTMREVVAQLKDCLVLEGMHREDGLSAHNSSTWNDGISSGVSPMMAEEGAEHAPSPR